MSLEGFEMLLREIGPLIKIHQDMYCGRLENDPKVQLLSVIWLLSTPDSFR